MRFTLDSNILIYAVDSGDPARRAIAAQLVERAALADAVLTAQALGEFLAVVRRKLPGRLPDAMRQALDWVKLFPVLPTTASSPHAALLLAERHKLQFWDALILGVARDAGATIFLSEDLADGANIDGVKVINPFSTANAPLIEKMLGNSNE